MGRISLKVHGRWKGIGASYNVPIGIEFGNGSAFAIYCLITRRRLHKDQHLQGNLLHSLESQRHNTRPLLHSKHNNLMEFNTLTKLTAQNTPINASAFHL